MVTIRYVCISYPLMQLSLTLIMITATIPEFRRIRPPGIREFVGLHMTGVKKLSPIHMFIHPNVDPAILNDIITEYITVRQILLLQEDDFVFPCIDSICSKLCHLVGIFESIDDVDPVNWTILFGSAWKPRSKIVLWITKPANDDRIRNVLTKFWSLNSLNVILVAMNDDSSNVIAYTYDPFWKNQGGSRGRLYTLSAVDIIYQNKMKDLQGYPITVSMYDSFLSQAVTDISRLGASSDIGVLLSLSSWLNFTIDLKSRALSNAQYSYGNTANGTFVDVTHDLITNYSEILGNSQFWEKVTDNVEYIIPHARASSLALVPQPKVVPKIIRIFQSFDILTFVLLILFSFIPVIYMYFKRTNGAVLNTFRLITQHQFYNIGPRMSERIFAISWVIFASLFMLIQQSRFVENMTNSSFEEVIDTLKELADSELTIISDPYQFYLLNRSSNEVKKKIARRAETKYSSEYCYENLMAKGNVACFSNTIVVSSAQKKSAIIHSPVEMHKMREYVGEYWRTFLVRKGLPYLSRFNVGMRRLIESGLVRKWRLEDQERVKLRVIPDAQWAPLTLLHLHGSFMIFLFGMVIATIAFIYEIIVYRRKLKWRNSCF